MKYTILIVEDEPSILKLISDDLLLEGYNVLEAKDGESGIKIALENRPDLIILDIMLPKISGFDVCKKVKEKLPRIPIIILSAKSQEEDKLYGFKLGADDYITKPFSMRELLARIKVLLQRVYPFEGKISFTGKVGIIITDMKDFTKKTSLLSKEEIIELMQYHSELLSSKAKEYGGQVINIVGDSSLILYENVNNAVLSAIAIQKELKEKNLTETNINRKIELRTAVHSGEISVTSSSGLAYGEAVNIAARVSKVAQPFSVYITEDVYSCLEKGNMNIQELGKFQFKGISNLIKLYKIEV